MPTIAIRRSTSTPVPRRCRRGRRCPRPCGRPAATTTARRRWAGIEPAAACSSRIVRRARARSAPRTASPTAPRSPNRFLTSASICSASSELPLEVEEVVPGADRLDAEHVRPQLGQRPLGRGQRRAVGLRQIRPGEPVDAAAAGVSGSGRRAAGSRSVEPAGHHARGSGGRRPAAGRRRPAPPPCVIECASMRARRSRPRCRSSVGAQVSQLAAIHRVAVAARCRRPSAVSAALAAA